MSNEDLSRSMYDARKRYNGTRLQQGRLITDADWNETEQIASEEDRRTRLDVIGSYGSSDAGYRVSSVREVNGTLEFDIEAGTLYLGGLRLELPAAETYQTQSDLLQISLLDFPEAIRRDLAFIEAYQAPVSALEDAELLDPALGGADTAQRMRRYARVRLIQGVGGIDCDGAWALLRDLLADASMGGIDANCANVVDTRLTVTYTEEGVDDDLCDPSIEGGYLGAENQAIRVQLVSENTLTWGVDNGSTYFRVTLSGDRLQITLKTPPRDLYSTPQLGQVIELLAWSAVLPNGEKTAALSGHLTRISDIDTNADGEMVLTLADALPIAGFDDWKQRPDQGLLEDEGIYYFMRLWNRGADLASSPAIPFAVGTPVTLGTTGIQVTVTGNDAASETYWVITARPQTPTQVLPWGLETGQIPDGVQRFYAPLALITHKSDGTFRVDDCRPPFRPLTAQNGCCIFTVGDGKNSTGDFDSIEEALARLPVGGGEICLLPGIHIANVVIANRSGVSLSGCGLRSKIIPANANDPTIRIVNSGGIGIFNLDVVAVSDTGIEAGGVAGLRIEDVRILAGVIGIDVDASEDVTIRRCAVRLLDRQQADVGIFVQADRVLIEDCDVQVIPNGTLPQPPDDDGDDDTPPVDPTDPCAEPNNFYGNLLYLVYYVDFIWGIYTIYLPPKPENPYLALGGIQIGSGSEQVTLRRNTISAGAGNGITLGSDIGDVSVSEEPDDTPREPEPFIFRHPYDNARGWVMLDGAPIGSLRLIFTDTQTGATFVGYVDPQGNFYADLPPAEYEVRTDDPNLAVISFESVDGPYYEVKLEKFVPQEQPPNRIPDYQALLAFIHDVELYENIIANMGLSGVGVPRFETSDLAATTGFRGAAKTAVARQVLLRVYLLTGTITGFVVNLTLHRNHIMRCLQNVDFPAAQNFLIERGIGGVSLALVDGLTLTDNTIENCGRGDERGAEMPICGVFASFAVDVTIKDNHIVHNGAVDRSSRFFRVIDEEFTTAPSTSPAPAQPVGGVQYVKGYSRSQEYVVNVKQRQAQYAYAAASDTPNFSVSSTFAAVVDGPVLRPGPRGAIVLSLCFSSNLFAVASKQTAVKGAAMRVESAAAKAASIQGMTTAALGRHAARIDGNFVVHPFGRSLFIAAVGSLSITDNQFICDAALTRELDVAAGGLVGAMSGLLNLNGIDMLAANVMILDLGKPPYIAELLAGEQDEDASVSVNAPGGNVNFNSNQIRQGDAGERPTLVTIFSLDDVGFTNNQIEALRGNEIRTTVVLVGLTNRAAENRMKEPLTPLTRGRGANEYSYYDVEANMLRGRFSLVNLGGYTNNTIGNQGHYCFLATGTNGAIMIGNISLMGDALGGCDNSNLGQFPADGALGILLQRVGVRGIVIDMPPMIQLLLLALLMQQNDLLGNQS